MLFCWQDIDNYQWAIHQKIHAHSQKKNKAASKEKKKLLNSKTQQEEAHIYTAVKADWLSKCHTNSVETALVPVNVCQNEYKVTLGKKAALLRKSLRNDKHLIRHNKRAAASQRTFWDFTLWLWWITSTFHLWWIKILVATSHSVSLQSETIGDRGSNASQKKGREGGRRGHMGQMGFRITETTISMPGCPQCVLNETSQSPQAICFSNSMPKLKQFQGTDPIIEKSLTHRCHPVCWAPGDQAGQQSWSYTHVHPKKTRIHRC